MQGELGYPLGVPWISAGVAAGGGRRGGIVAGGVEGGGGGAERAGNAKEAVAACACDIATDQSVAVLATAVRAVVRVASTSAVAAAGDDSGVVWCRGEDPVHAIDSDAPRGRNHHPTGRRPNGLPVPRPQHGRRVLLERCPAAAVLVGQVSKLVAQLLEVAGVRGRREDVDAVGAGGHGEVDLGDDALPDHVLTDAVNVVLHAEKKRGLLLDKVQGKRSTAVFPKYCAPRPFVFLCPFVFSLIEQCSPQEGGEKNCEGHKRRRKWEIVEERVNGTTKSSLVLLLRAVQIKKKCLFAAVVTRAFRLK